MALEQPDPDVLRRAQRGDERAFALILRAYETPIFNYVYRVVGDRALAEDLTQEVFVRVFQALPRFSLRCKFTTWLFQVTKNRVLEAVEHSDGVCLVTADHGNADHMLEEDGSPNTAHSMNPVPLIVTADIGDLREGGVLADVAPTILDLLGCDTPPGMTGEKLT